MVVRAKAKKKSQEHQKPERNIKFKIPQGWVKEAFKRRTEQYQVALFNGAG